MNASSEAACDLARHRADQRARAPRTPPRPTTSASTHSVEPVPLERRERRPTTSSIRSVTGKRSGDREQPLLHRAASCARPARARAGRRCSGRARARARPTPAAPSRTSARPPRPPRRRTSSAARASRSRPACRPGSARSARVSTWLERPKFACASAANRTTRSRSRAPASRAAAGARAALDRSPIRRRPSTLNSLAEHRHVAAVQQQVEVAQVRAR